MRTAFEIARTGRPGPVVIDIPKNVQNWEGTFKGEGACCPCPGTASAWRQLRRTCSAMVTARAFYELLTNAERPLIYCGGGAINGEAADECLA